MELVTHEDLLFNWCMIVRDVVSMSEETWESGLDFWLPFIRKDLIDKNPDINNHEWYLKGIQITGPDSADSAPSAEPPNITHGRAHRMWVAFFYHPELRNWFGDNLTHLPGPIGNPSVTG